MESIGEARQFAHQATGGKRVKGTNLCLRLLGRSLGLGFGSGLARHLGRRRRSRVEDSLTHPGRGGVLCMASILGARMTHHGGRTSRLRRESGVVAHLRGRSRHVVLRRVGRLADRRRYVSWRSRREHLRTTSGGLAVLRHLLRRSTVHHCGTARGRRESQQRNGDRLKQASDTH